jgi:surfeit locus 1 family protein
MISTARSRNLTVTRAGIAGSLFVLMVVLLCVRLGFWQLDRLEQKRTRNATAYARLREAPIQLDHAPRDTAGLIFRKAIVTGTYDDARTIIIAGRTDRGVPGVYVLTPLRVGAGAVLINRGFMPSADASHVELERIREPAPAGLHGMIVYLGHDEQSPDSAATGFKTVWYRPAIDQLRPQFPYPLASYVVQLLPAEGAPQYPLRLAPPALDEGPHMGYAIQWFGFAAIGVIGWLVLLLKRKKGGPQAAPLV